MARNKYPNGKIDDLPGETVKEAVRSLNDLYQLGKPETDEEVRERIDQYFEFCENSSVRPGIESLSLALGVTRTTLFNWQRGEGCSMERQELIIRAKSFVSAFIEQVMLNNRVYPATGIFLLKNWCNYRDSVEVEPVQQRNDPIMTQEEIRRIAADIESRHRGGEPEKPDLQELLDSLPD